ncbi:hypothetical protein V6N13_106614 [Hibiscus sabdariffa]|uniref:Uncharacterized protein n=1 Tax=Hibiscus sabdariffa TaxID=183260 RepID=A0ABR2F188_9ROSI
MQGNSLGNPGLTDCRHNPTDDSCGIRPSDRSPEDFPVISVSSTCERHGSPVVTVIHRTLKKSRNNDNGMGFSFSQNSMDFESDGKEQVGGVDSSAIAEGLVNATNQ